VRKSKLPLKKLYTRRLSNENWKRYRKMRYRIEQLFGSIKQKVGSSFKLLREDLARKASIAYAILWNFWVLATYLFLLFLSGILHYGYARGYGRFLEQPQNLLVIPKSSVAYFHNVYETNNPLIS
jgi:type II secretory pathway component PulL